MTSNVRRTFRPALEALESRLVPSFQWGTVSSPDFAAVLTVAQPAPALSSFNWGVSAQSAAGWDIGEHKPTAAQPAAASPPAVGLTLPAGDTTVLTFGAGAGKAKVNAPTLPDGPTTVVTAASFGQITPDEFTIEKTTDKASPTVVASPAITFVYGEPEVRP
jgi:hypothetical protein